MKYLLILLTFLSFARVGYSKSCNIETFSKVLYLPGKSSVPSNQIIKDSDCSEIIKSAFSKRIINSNGVISSKVINAIQEIQNTGTTVTLNPTRVKIVNLKNKFKDQFKLSRDWTFGKLKMLNRKVIIGLNEGDSYNLSCELCHTTGQKNISVTTHNPITSLSKTYWVQGTVYISASVLVPKRAISPSETQLTPETFVKKKINVTRPEVYFTNKDQLVFYKLNKPLSKGSGLKFTDLTPINLVSAGIPTKVILKSGGLVLQGTGIPSQSGKFGEVIKLQNPKTRRMIIGKVVDFNKVMVDL